VAQVAGGAAVSNQRRRQRESGATDARTQAPAVTLDIYADLFDDDLDAVADRMEEASTKFLAD